MKRSTFLRYLGASTITTLGLGHSLGSPAQAQGAGVSMRWYGHTCVLFTGGGKRILVNPFRTLGCTAGYPVPNPAVDYILMSSRLFDEGAPSPDTPGNPRILFQAGAYTVGSSQFEGIAIAHDRNGGRRFGTNVAWKWQQGGVNILHLGGAAAPIGFEQKILMGRPDILFVPVGGGPKAYNPQEAQAAIQALNPKIAVPTHYRTNAADAAACDITSLETFLSLYSPDQIRRLGSQTLSLSAGSLPSSGTAIYVFRDPV